MFTDLNLSPLYGADANMAEDFFNLVLKEAKSYDRVSAYFTAGALATYAEGLEYFARKGNKYRLIVSYDISEEDFQAMKDGYALRESISEEMAASLRGDLTLDTRKGLANLANLISLGIVDIRIAFKSKGIFHDKFGIIEDDGGNRICFRGSANETEAAMKLNYESIFAIMSWKDTSDGYYQRETIEPSVRLFDALWNGGSDDVIVKQVQDVVLREIMRFDRGKAVLDPIMLQDNALILDKKDDEILLHMNLGEKEDAFLSSGTYRVRVRPCVSERNVDSLKFKREYGFQKIVEIPRLYEELKKDNAKRFPDIQVFMTSRLRQYIERRKTGSLEIQERGRAIKRHDPSVKEEFDKFKSVVDGEMKRKLYERQMWDAFFMYAMERSGNFSVPGSGKTASVLGVYAYLRKMHNFKRVIVICPKNAFGSWIDEYKSCFGENSISVFNVQSGRVLDLEIGYGKYNVFLFNYEKVQAFETELSRLAQREDSLLIFDEVHRIKRKGGRRALSSLRVASGAPFVITLTGTPLPNGYADLYNLLTIIGGERYDELFGFSYQNMDRPTPEDVNAINNSLQPFYCRTTKEDLEVPKANADEIIPVLASKSENALFEYLKETVGHNPLVWMIRVLQLESDPQMLTEQLDNNVLENIFDAEAKDWNADGMSIPDEFIQKYAPGNPMSEKQRKCLELLRRLTLEGKTVVCWCIFPQTIDTLAQRLTDMGISARRIHGAVELSERQNIIEDFRSKKFQVLLANPHTLAESVSLHMVCHDAVYYEYSYNLVHLLQSKDRIHRLGLAKDQYTQYYFLESFFTLDGKRVSLDEQIYERLREKESEMLAAIQSGKLETSTPPAGDAEKIYQNVLNSPVQK